MTVFSTKKQDSVNYDVRYDSFSRMDKVLSFVGSKEHDLVAVLGLDTHSKPPVQILTLVEVDNLSNSREVTSWFQNLEEEIEELLDIEVLEDRIILFVKIKNKAIPELLFIKNRPPLMVNPSSLKK